MYGNHFTFIYTFNIAPYITALGRKFLLRFLALVLVLVASDYVKTLFHIKKKLMMAKPGFPLHEPSLPACYSSKWRNEARRKVVERKYFNFVGSSKYCCVYVYIYVFFPPRIASISHCQTCSLLCFPFFVFIVTLPLISVSPCPKLCHESPLSLCCFSIPLFISSTCLNLFFHLIPPPNPISQ